MLQLVVESTEFFDETREEFVTVPGQTLQLEHSLLSLAKWESKWKKPFLGKTDLSVEEQLDYIRCMTITRDVNPLVYESLTKSQLQEISDYINDPMTATTFNNRHKPASSRREVITSEIIYYWMIDSGIPFSCEKWHLNRLLTLIRVCGIKNSPQKKMSKREAANQQRSLNAARRARLGTRG